MDNQEWTIQRHMQHLVQDTERRQIKTKTKTKNKQKTSKKKTTKNTHTTQH
jgi:hypothetical protein